MKHLYNLALALLLAGLCYSQDVQIKRIDLQTTPNDLKEKIAKFIEILNGEIKDDIKTLFSGEHECSPVALPSDYPVEKVHKRPPDSSFEIKRLYRFNEDTIIMVYGIVGTEVSHDSLTSLWIKKENLWVLKQYSTSMKDTVARISAKKDK